MTSLLNSESVQSATPDLNNAQLSFDGLPLLVNVPPTVTTIQDPHGIGVFLRAEANEPADRVLLALGDLQITRFTACYRFMPYWMKPIAGTRGGEIPQETQFVIAELENGSCALLVPLLDGAFRASLQGRDECGLDLLLESGDPGVRANSFTGLFVAVGDDPYPLIEQAAVSVMAHMKTGRLRREKLLPAFADQFGWCTWDSFYREVSPEGVRQGLESFAVGGVVPKLLILDDGWQSVREVEPNELRLTAFAANEKFKGDLSPTVQMAKAEFGVENFFVWHALNGYYGGVDIEAMPEYSVTAAPRLSSPGILHHLPEFDGFQASTMGLISPDHVYRFFHDYHASLRAQGVDGVKVDVQTAIESVAVGVGGRVKLMQQYHDAMEGSAQTHFLGNLINCMSCSNDMMYSALSTTLTRTSDDFFPARPASHGLHLYANAFVSLWFGEFVHPDWDMFQSSHELGAYHAAGRALSGGPIYVSDKPDAHNFDLLRQLVLPDGTVLRANHVGRPTRDCLFADPTRDALLKIFNLNLDAGIVGAFNTRYEEAGTDPVSGAVTPRDIEGLSGENFAVFCHNSGEMRKLARDDRWELSLPQLTHELFTVVPIDKGIAPIGLADLFNSAGAITEKGWSEAGLYSVRFKAGGRVVLWSEVEPTAVYFEGAAWEYSCVDHRLETIIPAGGVLHVIFDE